MTGPGYRFIQQYDQRLPKNPAELGNCVRAYGRYLRRQSGQESTSPVDIEAVCDCFSLSVRAGSFKNADLGIDGANLAELGLILYEASDTLTRQRFTQAHELMENLIIALKDNQYPPSVRNYLQDANKKEQLCNWGASCLLMPIEAFSDLVSTFGIGIEAAGRIGRVFQTSRLATLWRMAYAYPRKCGLIIWKRDHKPSENEGKPDPNQLKMWEDYTPSGPKKKMRVQWTVFSKNINQAFYVPRHKSVEEQSLIVQAEEDRALVAGSEYVDLGDIKGTFDIEAVPFMQDDEIHILTLFHWPQEMFESIDDQTVASL